MTAQAPTTLLAASSSDVQNSSSDTEDDEKITNGIAPAVWPGPIGCPHNGKDVGVQIIVAGLMRTGLKTLRSALEELGYSKFYDQDDIVNSYSMWDSLLRNQPGDDPFPIIFEDAQVVMGLPTFCFWEQVLQRYPKARVILTHRNEDDWWHSVCRAKELMDNELPGAPMQYGSAMRYVEKVFVPTYHKFCEILRFAWATTLGAHALDGEGLNEVATRGNYRRHNSYVQVVLGANKNEAGNPQLLVYNVREGWAPLCKFLQCEVPKASFPKVMDVPYFLGHGHSKTEEMDVRERGRSYSGVEFATDPNLEYPIVPDGPFGLVMRQELRKSLTGATIVTTIMLAFILVVTQFLAVEVPTSFIAFSHLAVITVAWNAYVIMHGLVIRVPALVVLPMAMKSLLLAACLQACFITYGLLKEQIVTQDRIASPVLILSARLMSVVCGLLALLIKDRCISLGGVSLTTFIAFGLTNEASTWAGYEMLKYVSFPVQVMAKSCKLLPNMVMGRFLNGTHYRWSEYFQAVGAMVCVTVMHLTDEAEHKKDSKGSGHEGESELLRTIIGTSLLTMFFACDSFTSQKQTAIYKKHPEINQTQMMVAGNLVGVCITMGSLILRWGAVSKSVALLLQKPDVMLRVVLLGLSGAMGQFCIYSAIRVLGPLSFTWIMTSRQLFSVLISLVVFGHGVSIIKLACILTVFAIMSSKQLSRTVPVMLKQCSGCRERSSTRGGPYSPDRLSSLKFD